MYFTEPSCVVTYDLISSPQYNIPDSSTTASSEYSENYSARKSRLDSASAWSPPGEMVGEWISADLGENRIVIGVRTFGYVSPYSGAHGCITQFKVSTSTNGIDWSDAVDESGSTILFQGNTDGDEIVSNRMPTPIVTRHAKLTVIAYTNYAVLRWAIDGCLLAYRILDTEITKQSKIMQKCKISANK